jgi:hypothetical protein
MNYCGPIKYEFFNLNLTSFDSTNEIAYNLNPTTKTFSMATELPEKEGIYRLKLKVSLINFTSVEAEIKDFKVEFINKCSPPTSITPPSVSNQTYNLTHVNPL